MNRKILVGSQYFFKDIEGFNSKDVDYLILDYIPKNYKEKYQISGNGQCLFRWKKMSADNFIKNALETKLPMEIGKFFVVDFARMVGITINHLKQLEPVLEKLDEKHLYLKVIYNSYIENNDFVLTQEQRLLAYEEYKKARE